MDKHISSFSWYSINKPKYISFKYILSRIIRLLYGWKISLDLLAKINSARSIITKSIVNNKYNVVGWTYRWICIAKIIAILTNFGLQKTIKIIIGIYKVVVF